MILYFEGPAFTAAMFDQNNALLQDIDIAYRFSLANLAT
jgi:hypothetical protein